MILLYNVYLDDKVRRPGLYFRGLYGENISTIDVFKYTLNSVVNIYNWKKVIIKFELCDSYKNKESELLNYISLLFKDYDCNISLTRCKYQSDWKKLYEELNDDLIFFCCNHDHIFIDDDIIHFQNCMDEFRNEFSNEHATLYFSHWQEVNVYFFGHTSEFKNTFAYSMHDNVDSAQIITKKTYYQWWFSQEFPDKLFPRTDYFSSFIPSIYNKIQAVPYREFFRHFDGYSHIREDHNSKVELSNITPPLFIPHGFFENKIKLNVGFETNDNECVNINLKKENYTISDVNGTDLKCFLSEIPYCWKKRITNINIHSEYNELDHKTKRDLAKIYPFICGFFHGKLNNPLLLDRIKKSHNI